MGGLHHTLEARVFESVAAMVRDAVRTASEETTVELRAMAAEIRSLRTAAFSPATPVGLNITNTTAAGLQELLEGLQRIMEDIRRKLLSMDATKATQWHRSVAECPAAGHPGVPPLQTRKSEAAMPRVHSPSLSISLRSPPLVTRRDRPLDKSAAESTASTSTQPELNVGSVFALDSTLSPMDRSCSRGPSISAAMESITVSSQALASLQAAHLPLRSSCSHKTLAVPQCMDTHCNQSMRLVGASRSSPRSSVRTPPCLQASCQSGTASSPWTPSSQLSVKSSSAGGRLGGSLTPQTRGRESGIKQVPSD